MPDDLKPNDPMPGGPEPNDPKPTDPPSASKAPYGLTPHPPYLGLPPVNAPTFEQHEPRIQGCLSVFLALIAFIAGLIAGIVVPIGVLSFLRTPFWQGGKGRTGLAIAELINLGILGGIGFAVYRSSRPLSLIAGSFLTGISIAFLLNAICGLILLNVR